MKLKRAHGGDLGEAISMEDAISMLTIIFVLFVIFLVPLVSIDKARLEEKKQDTFWNDMLSYLDNNSDSQSITEQILNEYGNEFDMHSPLHLKRTLVQDSLLFIEYISSIDTSLHVIKHNRQSNNFNLLTMRAGGTSTTYRHGKLSYSRGSKEWFLSSEETRDIDGTHTLSKEFEKSYRSWRKRLIKKASK